MIRKSAGSACLAVLAAIATVTACIRTLPVTQNAGLPEPRFTQKQLIEKAASLCGVITRTTDPIHITVGARPSREVDGTLINGREVTCLNDQGRMLTYFYWDAVSGDLLSFSRDYSSTLPSVKGGTNRALAIKNAADWLRMSDAANSATKWSITGAVPRSAVRWIVSGEAPGRKAYVTVDRRTGLVITMVTWHSNRRPRIA